MKYTIALGFAALVAANPVEVRQTRIRSTEFTDGGCRENIFLFARGSTEVGNMGTVCGPPTSDGIKAALGARNVATEGIEYAAALSTNFLPGGADPAGIREMQRLLRKANQDCPDSTILVGGYSQGAALVHRAVEDQPQAIKNQIAGIVTFGDTQNLQDRGQVPNFPREKTKVICATGDLVCVGTLTITPAHLTYGRNAQEAADFLVQRARAASARKMKLKEKN